MQRAGWKQRTLGATLALLVQAVFLTLVMLSPSHPTRRLTGLAHETILLLQSLPRTVPATIDARGPASPKTRKAAPISVPTVPSYAAPYLAPLAGLSGFGHAIFGCAPEQYADLAPEERANCPKPGEGMTKNGDKDPLTEPGSHAKYEAMWQEQWVESHWVPAPCPPSPEGVAQCLLDQSIAEHQREQAAWAKIAKDQSDALKANTQFAPPPVRHEQSKSDTAR
jgi:hypothetical protein